MWLTASSAGGNRGVANPDFPHCEPAHPTSFRSSPMYIYAERWTPKQAWLALSAEQRKEFIEGTIPLPEKHQEPPPIR